MPSHMTELPRLICLALQADAACNHPPKSESMVADTLQPKVYSSYQAHAGDGVIKGPVPTLSIVPCQRIYNISDLPPLR